QSYHKFLLLSFTTPPPPSSPLSPYTTLFRSSPSRSEPEHRSPASQPAWRSLQLHDRHPPLPEPLEAARCLHSRAQHPLPSATPGPLLQTRRSPDRSCPLRSAPSDPNFLRR